MTLEHKEFSRQLKEFQSHWFHTIVAYEVYFKIWPTEQIIDVFNLHRGFFIPVRDSLYQTMMMGFAKVFDRDSRTMSLRNLLNTAQRHMELVPKLTQQDIQNMNAQLSKHETAMDTLKCLRDQKLAHLDAKPQPLSPLLKGQLDSLVATVGEAFNKLSAGHDGSLYSWSFQISDSATQTDSILSILQEAINARKAEIDRRLAELKPGGQKSTDAKDV